MTEAVPIRDAATVIVVRNAASDPAILMGQRGKNAVFMPEKFVFPGGAVDAGDARIPLAHAISDADAARLRGAVDGDRVDALAVAAIRELWEETGLCLGSRAKWEDAPAEWHGFAQRGLRPDASALSFFFRALTPPGRPRRFDARFFLVDANRLEGDSETFQDATDELSHLQWVPLARARELDLAFITELVLAELQRHLPSLGAPERVPFVKNDTLESQVIWL